MELFQANVNYQEIQSGQGEPPLLLCTDHNPPEIGRYLMSKGASIFAKDRSGVSPLSKTISKNKFWLVEEFFDSEEEKSLFVDSDETKLKEYVSWLFFAGYGSRIARFMREEGVTVSAAQAIIYFEQCAVNFKNMQEPVETYELLEKLMSSAL